MPEHLQVIVSGGPRPRPAPTVEPHETVQATFDRIDRALGVEHRSATRPCPTCQVPTVGGQQCDWCRRWQRVETRARRSGVTLSPHLNIDAAEALLDRTAVKYPHNGHTLTRSRPVVETRGSRCGICGGGFSTDPPCCVFGLDVANGRI